ncbi:MAG: hypothetical protein RIR18_1286, partial [Pseudomonadota bacterium]
MAIQLLTDQGIKNRLKTGETSRLDDGGGLYLLPKGEAVGYWRFDYTSNGKRKTLSMGTYPAVTLSLARKKAVESRELVEHGTDPSDLRKAAKEVQAKNNEDKRRLNAGLPAVDSFEAIAREWHQMKKPSWSK